MIHELIILIYYVCHIIYYNNTFSGPQDDYVVYHFDVTTEDYVLNVEVLLILIIELYCC